MLYAYYGHFEKLFVSINDPVKRGQVLGLAAELPARFKKKIRDMEPHLHFELFQPKEGFGSSMWRIWESPCKQAEEQVTTPHIIKSGHTPSVCHNRRWPLGQFHWSLGYVIKPVKIPLIEAVSFLNRKSYSERAFTLGSFTKKCFEQKSVKSISLHEVEVTICDIQ